MNDITPNPTPPHESVPADIRRRWNAFREVFRASGSFAAACNAAFPHLDPSIPRADYHGPGASTVHRWLRRYPELAAEYAEDRMAALGNVEAELARRSMLCERVPVFSRGQLVGWRESWRDANSLLLRRAARLDPDAWAARTQADVRVEHANQPTSGFAVTLQPEDVLLLPPSQRALLVELLTQIRDRKEGTNATRELIDAEPARPALGTAPGNDGDDAQRRGVPGAGGEGQGRDRDAGGS